MKTKLEEIVEDYHCYDSYGEGCDCDCEYCKKNLRSDLEELVKETREKVIEEFVSKYKDWCKNPCNCDSKVNGEICQGICIDCFVKETGLLEKEKKSEGNTNCDFKLIAINDGGFKYEEIFMHNHDAKVRAEAIDDLLKAIKVKASDCSYFHPTLFEKGYCQAYDDMCDEAKKLKEEKE